MKLVVAEAESDALAEHLQRTRRSHRLVSSLLLYTELHCAARRRPDDVDGDAVRQVLSTIDLVDPEAVDFTSGPTLPGRLRSADALHLATALRVGAECLVVYDAELAETAQLAGLRVSSPT